MKPLFGYLDSNDPSLLDGRTDVGPFVLDKGTVHDSTIMTDRYVLQRPYCEKLYMWVQESPLILPEAYRLALEGAEDFDLVFTPLKEHVGDNVRWAPPGGCWIPEEDRFMHEKTEMVSLIASDKNRVLGHALRHSAVKSLAHTNVDVFGHGYKPVEFKTEALAPYRYSITIENARAAGYFSEKLIDTLILGCIPIYWGDPDIGAVFDTDGFIIAEDLDGIVEGYARCSRSHYDELSDVIEKNRLTAIEYASVYTNLWRAGLCDE